MKRLVFVTLLLWLTAACTTSTSENEEIVEATADSATLPLTMLDGQTLDLADYEGQVVLVNFWAPWCAPCRIEMPELDSYYQAHRDDGFTLLAVNAGEPADRAADYLAQFDYSFPVVLDEDGEIDNYFGGVRGMPSSYILNGEGEVVYQHVGALTQAILEEKVTPLLP
jgi:thiol-disulfide isomerase/thioredoxin